MHRKGRVEMFFGVVRVVERQTGGVVGRKGGKCPHRNPLAKKKKGLTLQKREREFTQKTSRRRTRISLLPNILSNAFLKDVMAFPILTKALPAAAHL